MFFARLKIIFKIAFFFWFSVFKHSFYIKNRYPSFTMVNVTDTFFCSLFCLFGFGIFRCKRKPKFMYSSSSVVSSVTSFFDLIISGIDNVAPFQSRSHLNIFRQLLRFFTVKTLWRYVSCFWFCIQFHSGNVPSFMFVYFYWSTVDVQFWVSFGRTAKWFSYTHAYSFICVYVLSRAPLFGTPRTVVCWLRDCTCTSCVSCVTGGFFTAEPPGNPYIYTHTYILFQVLCHIGYYKILIIVCYAIQ